MTLRLTAAQARRARARAQLLGAGDGRVTGGVGAVARTLVGVQAQDLAATALCVRPRTSGLDAAAVPASISGAGDSVVLWTLRGTRHLHHRDDARWLLGLLGPVFGRPGRRAEQLGIAGTTGAAAVEALRAALVGEGALTRSRVKDVLALVGVDPSGQAPIHVVRRAALEGVLCIAAGADGEERYVALDDRVPPAGATLDPDEAAAELARRYLAAHAPATPADFAAWSGLPAPAARRAWAAVAGELEEVKGPGGPWWVLAGRAQEVDAAARAGPVPLRLVGGFDSLLLGYADRSPVLDPGDAPRVSRGGGMVPPLVVGDGRVVGTWAYRRGRPPHRVDVTCFRRLTRPESAALAREATDVGRFLGTSPELVVNRD